MLNLLTPLQGGELVFFWGAHDILSDGIRTITGGLKEHAPSHSGMVYDVNLLLPDGSKQTEWYLLESTILNGKNGVQLNKLADRVNGYDGAVAITYLSERIRSFLNWPAIWGCAQQKLGVVHYNIAEIAAYLANLVLPQPLAIDKSDPNAVVCSELLAELLQAGGFPGLDPFRTPPERLFQMRMYREIAVLSGNPYVDDFNRV